MPAGPNLGGVTLGATREAVFALYGQIPEWRAADPRDERKSSLTYLDPLRRARVQLTLWSGKGRNVSLGWFGNSWSFARSASRPLVGPKTARGIGLGATRAQVEAAYCPASIDPGDSGTWSCAVPEGAATCHLEFSVWSGALGQLSPQ